jgi:hypothetical protein
MDLQRRVTVRRRRRLAARGLAPGSYLQFLTACTAGETFDPTVTLVTGCPHTPHWDFGNGDTYDGTAVSYDRYTDEGPHTVTLVIPQIATWLKTIDLQNDKISGDLLTLIRPCLALNSLTAHNNTALTGDIALLAELPALEIVKLGDNTAVTGDIASLATITTLKNIGLSATLVTGSIGHLAAMTQLTNLDLHGNEDTPYGNITGDLADLSALTGLTQLFIRATNITGTLANIAALSNLYYLECSRGLLGPTITGALSDLAPIGNKLFYAYLHKQTGVTAGSIAAHTAIRIFHCWDMAWDQAAVDAVLLAIYNASATFTYTGTIELSIGGNNAAPSGTYQDAVTPSTGKEYIYKLCNDPDAEGFKKWRIIYNNDGAGNVTRP